MHNLAPKSARHHVVVTDPKTGHSHTEEAEPPENAARRLAAARSACRAAIRGDVAFHDDEFTPKPEPAQLPPYTTREEAGTTTGRPAPEPRPWRKLGDWRPLWESQVSQVSQVKEMDLSTFEQRVLARLSEYEQTYTDLKEAAGVQDGKLISWMRVYNAPPSAKPSSDFYDEMVRKGRYI